MIPPRRLVLASFETGLELDVEPFLLTNDAFPVLENAFIWRKRVLKKPGSNQLGKLQRDISAHTIGTTSGAGAFSGSVLNAGGLKGSITGATNANPCSITSANHNLSDDARVTISGVVGMTQLNGNTYTVTVTGANTFTIGVDSSAFGAYVSGGTWVALNEQNLTIKPGSVVLNDGTNNYTEPATPNGTLVGAPGGSGTIDYITGAVTITGGALTAGLTAAFSYYPRLPVLGIEEMQNDFTASSVVNTPETVYFDQKYAYEINTGTSLFQDASFYKTSGAPIFWTGPNYAQFWSTNYQNAMFVTNNNPGMHFVTISAISSAATAQITTSVPHTLQTGDQVFINETTGTAAGNLNMKTFTVTRTGATTFTVPADTSAGINNVGIVQYLTRRSPTATGDGIQWYDGLPSSPSFTNGFVNFAPPLDDLSTSSTTYLVGARMIIPYGSRLLCFGTFEQTSSGSPVYYQNRIRYCQIVGTCFYANAPANQGTLATAWISNRQGFGGFVTIDTPERIVTAGVVQDVLILGMEKSQRRLTVTGIDALPFRIQKINPELGSESTFSLIAMDRGLLTVGDYGLILSTSVNAERFDEKIPDQVFEIQNNYQGNERVCAARDFQNEIIYFTYPSTQALADTGTSTVYPNKTILYNYRNQSFAIWKEYFTTYGQYRGLTGKTWEQLVDFTWEEWNQPWNSGFIASRYPAIAGGTPQGYVMVKYQDTLNGPSLYISAVTGQQITSPFHGLEEGDYVGFQGVITTTPPSISITSINRVRRVIDVNNFEVEGTFSATPALTEMIIIDNFDVQTKQFPIAWEDGKKGRLGTQRFFLDKTTSGEFTVDLLGSQSPVALNNPAFNLPNQEPIVISSNIVRTRPDDSLGLYDAAGQQSQIWHRLSNSIIGDTVQLRMYMSDAQMTTAAIVRSDWTLHAITLDIYPSRTLA